MFTCKHFHAFAALSKELFHFQIRHWKTQKDENSICRYQLIQELIQAHLAADITGNKKIIKGLHVCYCLQLNSVENASEDVHSHSSDHDKSTNFEAGWAKADHSMIFQNSGA